MTATDATPQTPLPTQAQTQTQAPVPARAPVAVTPPTPWDTSSYAGLRAIWREDRETLGQTWSEPGCQMLAIHRLGHWLDDPRRSAVVRRVGNRVHRGLHLYQRNVIGFDIPRSVVIGRRVRFVHQHGVAIHPLAEIGDDCLIRHNVTVGARYDPDRPAGYYDPPRIGARVSLGVGSVVLGAVLIGDGAHVGPTAVVTRDVPAGASVTAPMSRTMTLRP